MHLLIYEHYNSGSKLQGHTTDFMLRFRYFKDVKMAVKIFIEGGRIMKMDLVT